MRVIVNQLAALGRRTGIGHYTAELLRCLRPQAPGVITAFPDRLTHRARQAYLWVRGRMRPEVRGGSDGTARVPLQGAGRTILARYFRTLCRLRTFDLYHEPNCVPMPCDVPTIVTLHDLSVILHPEWHPADRIELYDSGFREGLKQTAHVLTVSDFARQEIIDILGISPERVTRVYNGVFERLRPLPEVEVAATLKELGLPPRYLLYLGTLEPRKNVLTLMKAYCALPAEIRERYPLVLVGGWGWRANDVANYLDDEAKARGVIHLGYVADAHLPALYNGARALAFPSLYEGFGLPPIEMMACGGAVLASTAGAVAETAGAAAHLIDPYDLDGWRAALLRVCTDDDWWRNLRSGALEAARPFTWERCAAETLAVYRKVAQVRTPLAA
jgi:alpha-1,3-rhamnosyl/mannosyltransferase